MITLVQVTDPTALDWGCLRQIVTLNVGNAYPNIRVWLDKVARELDRRVAYVAYADATVPIGAVILKKGKKRTKLCHLSVMPDYQGAGVGSALLATALKGCTAAYFTIPKSVWEHHRQFFGMFGFSVVLNSTLSQRQYRKQDPELYASRKRAPPVPLHHA